MELKYIELKTGWNDNGPAWIGFVKESRSGKMVYFNDHAFQRGTGLVEESSRLMKRLLIYTCQ